MKKGAVTRCFYDNTLIVITSDHGEAFGEHNVIYYDHVWHIYNTFVNIPLIFKFTKEFNPKNKIVTTPTESIDIAPTILDYFDIDIPSKFEGKSLLNLINGGLKKSKRYLFQENGPAKYSPRDKIYGIEEKDWKFIFQD